MSLLTRIQNILVVWENIERPLSKPPSSTIKHSRDKLSPTINLKRTQTITENDHIIYLTVYLLYYIGWS